MNGLEQKKWPVMTNPDSPSSSPVSIVQFWQILLACQATGILLSYWDFPDVPFFSLSLTTLLLISVLAWSRKTRYCLILICMCGGLLWGFFSHQRILPSQNPYNVTHLLRQQSPRLLAFRGWVTDRESINSGNTSQTADKSPSKVRLIFKLSCVEGGNGTRKVTGNILVELPEDLAGTIAIGNPYRITGWIEPLPEALNPGSTGVAEFWRLREIHAGMFSPRHTLLEQDNTQSPILWRKYRDKIRETFRSNLRQGLSANHYALVEALVLGIRDDLSRSDRNAFRDTGTMHLLAISGLHLQVVAMFFLALAQRLRFSSKFSAFGLILCVVFYAMVVTGGASIARSVCMTACVALATMRDRNSLFWHRMTMAGVLVLWIQPCSLFDPGAQLSFLGTASIYLSVKCYHAMTHPLGLNHRGDFFDILLNSARQPAFFENQAGPNTLRFAKLAKCVRFAIQIITPVFLTLLQTLLISLAVWSTTSVLVAYHFGSLNPVAILLNLPMVPLTSLALITGLSGMILNCTGIGFVGQFFCLLSGSVMETATSLLNSSLQWGFVPWKSVGIDTVTVTGFYLLAGLGAMNFPKCHNWQKKMVIFIMPLVWLSAGPQLSSIRKIPSVEHLQIEMLAVDHGLAVLIQWPDENWLYDCGQMGYPNVGRNVIAPALKARQIQKLDKVFLTHADSDHFNGLVSLIDSGIGVDQVLTTEHVIHSRQPDVMELRAFLNQYQIPITAVHAGMKIRKSDDSFAQVRHPNHSGADIRADNETSLVLLLESQGMNCLLTGDLENDGLLQLLMGSQTEVDPIPVIDVLMAPHHGGISSNPAWFYERLKPQLILSSQSRSRFGMAIGLESRIQSLSPNSRLLVTSRDGAISLTWQSEGIHFETYRSRSASGLLIGRGNPALERRRGRSSQFVLNP